MSRKYQEILLELVEAVRDQCEDTCILFTLEVTGRNFSFQFENRDSGCLKNEGISMRNLKGDFIK